MNTVLCPHCKKQVELSEAIIHEFQDKIREEEKKNLKAQFEKQIAEEQAEQEKKLRLEFEEKNKDHIKQLEEIKQKEQEAAKREQELLASIAKEKEEREKVEAQIREEAHKKASEEVSAQLKQKDSLLEEIKKKEEESLKREKELMANIAKEKEEREKAEAIIKEEAQKKAADAFWLEKKEYQKKIDDMQKALEEAQRKGKQGSQQLQGDVLELELEERLRQQFPYDEFKPVPTGIKGADIVQTLKNKFGNSAGVILWEAKRTKTWDKKWLTTLKDNMRAIGASDCIIVTNVLPKDVKIYDRIENVWVTSYEYALKLATVVRFGLLNVAIVRSTANQTDNQLKDLYRVITSDSFRQMFEARDETITAMRLDLEADKRATERRWKRQSVQIDKLDRNNSQLYGELQAHIPSLKPLQDKYLELESGEEENIQSEAEF